mgnify:CR=1 FL=1
MKQLLVVFSLLLVSATTYAQKNFSTSTAVVRFIAVDDTDIDATNKKAVSRLQSNGDMSFIMLMKDFTFDMDKMQEHFNEEYVESDKFPKAEFKGAVANNAAVNYSKDGTYAVTVKGKLTMHGQTKDVEAPGKLIVQGGKVNATASFAVLLADYGVSIPGVVADKVNKTAKIEVACNLEPLKS